MIITNNITSKWGVNGEVNGAGTQSYVNIYVGWPRRLLDTGSMPATAADAGRMIRHNSVDRQTD